MKAVSPGGPWHRWLWRAAGAMAMASCALLGAAHAADAPRAPPGDPTPWLMRIHDAARLENFQGTFVATGMGAAMSAAHIAHYGVGNEQYERIESLDGPMRIVYRHGPVVRTAWPEHRVALVEQHALMNSFPALLQGGGDRIAEHYDIALQGHGRVAGHLADILQLTPRDALRYGYRLWAEHRSGLLLRADVVGDKGEVLESSAFSDVVIGVKPPPAAVLAQMDRLDGYRVLSPAFAPTDLAAEGWRLQRPVAGFEPVNCVRRHVGERPDVGAADARPPVVQAIFADGLTYVSVFIEPYDAQRHPQALMTAVGATQTLMRREGDAWVTFVGDVPPAALRAFSAALQRKE